MACYATSVYPNNLLEGQSKEINIVGAGFISPISIIIGGFNISPSLMTPTLLKFIIPTIPVGTYHVIIVNGDGTRWVSQSAFTINANSNMSSLIGSAACPIVLQQRIVDSTPTAQQNSNLRSIMYTSPASVTVDSETNTAVGTLSVDSSYISDQGITPVATATSSNANATITSPWGTFVNINS
jgi:hypothetical protein